MRDCWELRPNQFKLKIEANPDYIPNQRQINLLKESGESWNLTYLYRRGLINFSEFIWNLVLADDPSIRQKIEELDWTSLDPNSNLKQLHILISTILSVTNDQSLARTILIQETKLRLLVEEEGPLTPPLLLNSEIYRNHLTLASYHEAEGPQALFRSLDWEFLQNWGHYLIRIPGEKLNQESIEALNYLAREDPLRFNQLFSSELMSTTRNHQRIFNDDQLVNQLFNILFYDQPSEYSLTPLLLSLTFDPFSQQYRPVNIWNNLSVEQKVLIRDLLKELIHWGVNQRTYQLAYFLNLIKWKGASLIPELSARHRRLAWVSRFNELMPHNLLIVSWLEIYLNLRDPPLSLTPPGKNFQQSIIETLIVNEDVSVFDLYHVPLQSLLKVLVSTRSVNFAKLIVEESYLSLDMLPSSSFQYPTQTDFYRDPCWGEGETYPDEANLEILKILMNLGLIYQDNPIYQRFRQRVIDQNETFLALDSSFIFNPDQYYLDWLQTSIKSDNPNYLVWLASQLELTQFRLDSFNPDSHQWQIQLETGKVKTEIQRASQKLSQHIINTGFDPYVADQISILATNFSVNQFLLFYRSLDLPYQTKYADYDRQQLALVTFRDLNAQIEQNPQSSRMIIRTIRQLLDFMTVSDLDQLSDTYETWKSLYLETYPEEEIVFNPLRRDFIPIVKELKIWSLAQLNYSTLRELAGQSYSDSFYLDKFLRSSSPSRVLDLLRQTNLAALLIELLNQKEMGLVYELLDRIHQAADLRSRLQQSALYLLIELVNFEKVEDYFFKSPSHKNLESNSWLYDFRLFFYYQADPLHSLAEMGEYWRQITKHFDYPYRFRLAFLHFLLPQLISQVTLQEGQLSLPGYLSKFDPSLVINSEIFRLMGLMDRSHFQPLELDNLAGTSREFNLDYVKNYQPALTLLSWGQAPRSADYFSRVFNLYDFENLAQLIPVYFNLVDHGQVESLEELINRVPQKIRLSFIYEARKSFRYHYRLKEPFQRNDNQSCSSSQDYILLSPLILVPHLSSILSLLIEAQILEVQNLLNLSYEIFQNMVYQQDWDILALYQRIPDWKIMGTEDSYDPRRSHLDTLLDVVMILGQLSDVEEIQQYYSLRSLSLNDQLLRALKPERFLFIYQLFQELELSFRHPEDFISISLAEQNQYPEIAQQFRSQYQMTNINPQFPEILAYGDQPLQNGMTNGKEVLQMITCLTKQGRELDRDFYLTYQPFLGPAERVEGFGFNKFKELFRLIIFEGRMDVLYNLGEIYGLHIDLVSSDHEDWLYNFLEETKLIYNPLTEKSAFQDRALLDQNLSRFLEILYDQWGMGQYDLQGFKTDNKTILFLGLSGLNQSLLMAHELFPNLTISELSEEDLDLISDLIEAQQNESLKILLEEFKLKDALDEEYLGLVFKRALGTQNYKVLNLFYEGRQLTLSDLGLNETRLAELNSRVEEFQEKLLADYPIRDLLLYIYNFEANSDAEVILVETLISYQLLDSLERLAPFINSDYLKSQSSAILQLIGETDQKVELLRILRDDYGFTAQTFGLFKTRYNYGYIYGYIKYLIIENELELLKALPQIFPDFESLNQLARAHDNETLITASARGYVEALRILHNDYGLTTEDARTLHNLPLREAASSRQTESLQVLHDVYGLTTEDARARNNEALVTALRENEVEVIRVLHNVYGLTREDAQKSINRLIIDYINFDVLGLVEEVFGFRPILSRS